MNTSLLTSLIYDPNIEIKIMYLLFEKDKQDKFLGKNKQNNHNNWFKCQNIRCDEKNWGILRVFRIWN